MQKDREPTLRQLHPPVTSASYIRMNRPIVVFNVGGFKIGEPRPIKNPARLYQSRGGYSALNLLRQIAPAGFPALSQGTLVF